MNRPEKALTPRLVKKLWLAFITIIILVGASYILITGFFANKHNLATAQRVHANMANHLIEEKFQNSSPFLEDGSINKPLFGDLMHDMMAVNRSIEVYLLSKKGEVLYSVVLDHDENKPATKVSLTPIDYFLETNGENYILGDDPRDPNRKKIFSAAPFNSNGREGYIYIILTGEEFQAINDNLFSQYFIKLSLGATLLTIFFAALIASLSIWFLTKNLRLIIQAIQKFQEGDLNVRIEDPKKSDIEVFANSFNNMADTIVDNIEKIKSVDTLRRELVANVSHDLRTPLAVMKGYVETLQIKKETLSENERQEYLQITHDNIDKLSKLINQLFEYSKLEAKQVTPIKEPFSITELSYDLLAKFNVLAKKKAIELELNKEEENSFVYADVSLVERALQNLIENAIKYTESDGKVTLSIKRKDKNIEINITDTGTGIPTNEQPFIFDRHKQLNKSSKKQGSGLGLAIVKKIMDLHDTTITVLSKPKKGSSFVFNLPAAV